MKWFKHISDSLDDPFIFELVASFGGDGYLVFFGCLEVMAREFHPDSPETCTVSERFLTKKLQLSRQKLVKILSFCEKNRRIFSTWEGGSVTLNCPKFLEMCDEWTRKQLRSNSGVTPKILRHELELEEEVDKEEELRPPIAPHRGAGKPKAKDRRLACFLEAQAAYPQAYNRHLASETTGRNSYTADLQAHENHGFATEATMHEYVMGQIRKASNSERWLEDGGQFIPGIGKWFKNRLWRGNFGRDENPLANLSKAGQQQALNCQDFLEAGNGRQA